jgi:hypothetical protein
MRVEIYIHVCVHDARNAMSSSSWGELDMMKIH